MIKNVLKTTGIFVAMFAIFAITSAFSSIQVVAATTVVLLQ